MNPARTFGPALASHHWNNHYVYWVGPMIGGALAAGVIHGLFLIYDKGAIPASKPARTSIFLTYGGTSSTKR